MASSVRGPISKCELEYPRGRHSGVRLGLHKHPRTENLETHTHHGCGGQGSDRGERGSVRKIKLTGKAGLRGLSPRDNNSCPSDCSSLPALALPLRVLLSGLAGLELV